MNTQITTDHLSLYGRNHPQVCQRILLARQQSTDQPDAYFREFLRVKVRIGTQDLRIAAIVMANNATLLMKNRRDFEKVPGLKIEDWSI